MSKIKYGLISVGLLIAIFGLFFNGQSGNVTKADPKEIILSPSPHQVWSSSANLPSEELMYRFLFDEIADLMQKDKDSFKLETAFKNSFYDDRLGLKPSQFAALDGAVAEYLEKARSLDGRAREIINQYRAQYPNGELEKPKPTPQKPSQFGPAFLYSRVFEPLPPPPVELVELQTKRNQIAVELKDKLRKSFGETDFLKFEAAVRKNATAMIVPQISHKPEQVLIIPGNSGQ